MLDFSGVKAIAIPEGDVVKIELGGTILWKREPVNLVPTSIDTDGSVYQRAGYISGYRLSSSGGLSSQHNTVTTGFIPFKAGGIVRMAGVSWTQNVGYCYQAFYDSSFTLLGSHSIGAGTFEGAAKYQRGNVSGATRITIENGVTTFVPAFSSNADKVAYFRLNGYGSGADMFVTINEEIDV